MSTKPLIGLTVSYYNHKEMDRSILGKSYTDSIQRAGGLPVLIPPIDDSSDLAALLDRLDGIVFTGGDDLNPSSYAESGEPFTPKPLHARRMSHDRQVFEYVWSHRMPALGICLGMQEINVFLGGSLYQDIPAMIQEPVVHKIGEWFEARHPVMLEPDSRIFGITGYRQLDTNSAHHQAVRAVAPQLKITGRASDGVIEVLEPLDTARTLLAVQWHPESETNDQPGIRLLEWLVEQATIPDSTDKLTDSL